MLTKLTAKINPPTLNFIPANDVERLKAWIERGRVERFLVETMVSPAMAQELLSRNDDNRAPRQRMIDEYSAAMSRGEWELNGQSIIIASDGRLNDGQHRLHAIIAAGVSVPIGLYFGADRASVATVDVGAKRTLGDHATMRGYPNANLLAAAGRLAWSYDRKIFSMTTAPSVVQLIEYIEQNPDLANHLHIGRALGSEFKASNCQFAFASFVCGRVNPQIASETFTRIKDGLGLTSANMPAARARERLMQHLSGRSPLRKHEAAAITIKAFNGALAGRRLRQLSWANNGVNAEAFPIAGA